MTEQAVIRDVYGDPVTVDVIERREDYSSVLVGEKLVLWSTEALEMA